MAYANSHYSTPVTQQAVVTVNAAIDRVFANYRKNLKSTPDWLKTSDDYCYSIMPREMVFRLRDKYDTRISRPSCTNGVNDIALKVFSNCNNMPISDADIQMSGGRHNSSLSKTMREMVTFVGVATTSIDYTNNNQKDTLALQIGGSITTWNTGYSTIRPGQKLVWDVPNPNIGNRKRKIISGEPKDKALFVLTPLEDAFKNMSDFNGVVNTNDFISILHDIHSHTGPVPAKNDDDAATLHFLFKTLKDTIRKSAVAADEEIASDIEINEAAKNYNRAIVEMYNEINSRVIGIALSGGAPGDMIDIMLCSAH